MSPKTYAGIEPIKLIFNGEYMNTTTIDLHEVVARLTSIHKELEIFAGTLVKLAEDCDPSTSGPINLVARRLAAVSVKILDVHNDLSMHLADQKMPRWRR